MDISDLRLFLEKFGLDSKKIDDFIGSKKLFVVNRNVFLSKKSFEKNQVFGEGLVFIKLNKLLPSTFLLNFILETEGNFCELKSEKQALNFTFGKSLSFDSVKEGVRFSRGSYYLVVFEKKFLGYVELNKNDKKFPLKNLMNVGEYLKEN